MWNPTPNWQPSSSFVQPVTPPGVEPDSAPGVSVCFSRAWLPYVIGAINQLIQPTTWATDDPDVRQTALERATALQAMFGAAEGCMQIRWSGDDCAIQTSTDNGATWSDITDWNLAEVQACILTALSIRITGGLLQWSIDGGTTWGTDGAIPPPNPQGASTDQQACNIATWLAVEILSNSLGAMGTAITDGKNLFDAFESLILLVADLDPITAIAVNAATVLFNGVTSIGAATVSAAATDPVLQALLQCAIYDAIKADGFVTDANYPTIITNINAISYGTPTIIGLINDYLEGAGPIAGIGAAGLEGMQFAGALYQGDCSSCGTAGANCWVLNGTSSAATFTGTINFGSGSWTIGGWYVNNSGVTGRYAVYQADPGPSTHAFVGVHNGGGPTIIGTINDQAGHGPQTLSAIDSDGVAQFVVLKWDAAAGSYLYLQGGQQQHFGVGALTGPYNDVNSVLTMGEANGFGSFWSGKLWGWAVYNTALSASDIAVWYARGTSGLPPAGYTHYWPMNEGTGSTLHDLGGSPLNGSMIGTVTWGTHP